MISMEAVEGRVRAGTAMVVIVLGAVLAFAATPAMAEFSLQKFAVSARNRDGTPDVQAGSHPYSLTTTFVLNPLQGDPKDARLELPPGFIGDPNATPKCSFHEFAKQEKSEPNCSSDTAVGVATTYLTKAEEPEVVTPTTVPVFNLVPPKGVVAEFGYIVDSRAPVLLTTSVRTGGDYGLTTSASNVNQAVLVLASKVTIWGVPANPAHNLLRGGCEGEVLGGRYALEEPGNGLDGEEDELEGPITPAGSGSGLPELTGTECASQAPEVPLLANPTSCAVPRTATLSVDSWEEPGVFRSKSVSMPEISGCGSLDFSPTIGVTPERSSGSTPTGLGVDVRVPQEATENPAGLAEGTVRSTTVALPAGVQVNPSSADARQACSNAQVGFTGFKELDVVGEPGVQTPQFTAYLPGSVAAQEAVAAGTAPQSEGTLEPGVNFCPNASKIANVRIKTPVLEGELEGGMYLAAPQNFAGLPENPFSSLIAMYLVAEEPSTGVLVKLPGRVTPNPVTGQLTASFEQTPAYPVSDLHVEFYGGERASLATPALCGSYASEASLTPWSSAVPVNTFSSFAVTSGPNGGPCSSDPLPFAPSLAAGTTNATAGAFSPLTTTFSREDGQQAFRGATFSYPPGITAVLTGVPLCGEAQANAGSCSAASQIGEATASAGFGSDPYTVTGGRVYLSEGYDGAPFGLSTVIPAHAGPFVLDEGQPVVVRAKLEINPLTAAATVTTTGEIPHILDGIPLEVKHVNVTVNRPGFALNPTTCDPMSVTGSIAGGEGATSPVSTPFQLANCANLKFQAKVTVAAAGRSSKKDGASLNFKISYPKGVLGSQAWFDEAKFDIPKQLPARLTTLQQACLAATFEHDRAACPKHSIVGQAIVHTPVIPEPLTGLVYFVSYGNAEFPDVVLVLHGYGVNIELRGETLIKNGVTSATFRDTPDVPFESIEVDLPTGEYSEFGTNLGLGKYDFCGHKLAVPTFFKAQNGLEIRQQTPVMITGCSKASSHHKKAKKKTRHHRTKDKRK